MPAGPLEAVLRSHAGLSFERVVRILDDLAPVLDAAHRMGVVHGDVTPSSIMIDHDGRAHLANLRAESMGIAEPDTSPVRSTAHSAYQPPEQRRRQPTDGRADQYALAVIAYELLTGQRRSDAPVVQGIQTVEPMDVLADVPLRRGVGLHANAALRRALSASPANRFPTVGAFVNALADRTPREPPSRQRAPLYRRLRRKWRTAPVATAVLALGLAVVVSDARTRTGLRQTWSVLSRHAPWLPDIRRAIPLPTAGTGSPALGAPGVAGVAPKPASTTGAVRADPSTSAPAANSPSLPLPAVPAVPVRSWAARVATMLGVHLEPPPPAPATGFIAVTADSGSALVIIDGYPRGTTPYLGQIIVGRHSVAAQGWGVKYRPLRTLVTVTQLDTARVVLARTPRRSPG